MRLARVDPRFGAIDLPAVERAMIRLVDAPYGDEPKVLLDLAENGIPGRVLYEAVALTSAELLARSGYDAHAVTGIHCVLDILHSAHEDPETLGSAWCTILLGQRTRRQKEVRDRWRHLRGWDRETQDADTLREVVRHDPEGLLAYAAAANALQSGMSPRSLARGLMEVALTTADPFNAMHNVKMLWGQLVETERSQCPQLAWGHLAAGAGVVAQTAAKSISGAEPVLTVWRESGLASDNR